MRAHDLRRDHDLGRCGRCGGRVAATHMLTKTYEVDEHGRWQRRFDDFVEDVIVVCADCGDPPEGRFEEEAGMFAFIPERAHREHESGAN